jgi:hypothetical protein
LKAIKIGEANKFSITAAMTKKGAEESAPDVKRLLYETIELR